MKMMPTFMVAVAAALLAGCASRNSLVLDTVGPRLTQPAQGNSATGNLVVYSAFDTAADFSHRNVFDQLHSDYKILKSDGTLWKQVHNDTGTIQQNPPSVQLPVGHYMVVAQANGYGAVTVPVVIAPAQRTVLHLEGGNVWPDDAVFNGTNAVRLPDGFVVGWRGGGS